MTWEVYQAWCSPTVAPRTAGQRLWRASPQLWLHMMPPPPSRNPRVDAHLGSTFPTGTWPSPSSFLGRVRWRCWPGEGPVWPDPRTARPAPPACLWGGCWLGRWTWWAGRQTGFHGTAQRKTGVPGGRAVGRERGGGYSRPFHVENKLTEIGKAEVGLSVLDGFWGSRGDDNIYEQMTFSAAANLQAKKKKKKSLGLWFITDSRPNYWKAINCSVEPGGQPPEWWEGRGGRRLAWSAHWVGLHPLPGSGRPQWAVSALSRSIHPRPSAGERKGSPGLAPAGRGGLRVTSWWVGTSVETPQGSEWVVRPALMGQGWRLAWGWRGGPSILTHTVLSTD